MLSPLTTRCACSHMVGTWGISAMLVGPPKSGNTLDTSDAFGCRKHWVGAAAGRIGVRREQPRMGAVGCETDVARFTEHARLVFGHDAIQMVDVHGRYSRKYE